MARSPPWLQTLFSMLTEDAPERSPSTGPDKSTGNRSSSRNKMHVMYGPAGSCPGLAPVPRQVNRLVAP